MVKLFQNTTQPAQSSSEDEYTKLKNKGFSDEEIAQVGVKNPNAQPTSIWEVHSMLWTIGNNIKTWYQKFAEPIQWAVTWTVRSIWDVWAFLTRHAGSGIDAVLPWTPVKDFMSPVANKFQQWAEWIASWIEGQTNEAFWLDQNSLGSKMGQIAWPLLAGVGAESLAVKWLTALSDVWKAWEAMSYLATRFPRLAPYLAKIGKAYVGGTWFDVASTGKTDTSLTGNASLSAGISAAFPILWAAARGLSKLTWVTTKMGEWVQEVFDVSRKWGKDAQALSEAMSGNVTGKDILEKAQQAIKILRDNKRIVYGDSYDKFLKESSKVGNLDNKDIVSWLFNKLRQFKVEVPTGLEDIWARRNDEWKNATLQSMFSRSSIVDKWVIDSVKSTLDDLTQGFKSSTLDNLDTLKHRVQGTIEQSWGHPILNDLYDKINKKLTANSPVYEKMSATYKNMNDVIQEISQGLKPDWNKAIAINKLLSSLRDSSQFRQQAVEELERASGIRLKPSIAWVSGKNWVQPNFAAQFATTAWLAALGFWPKTLLLLAAASPKVVTQTARLLGVSAKLLDRAIKAIWPDAISSITRNAIPWWIKKATE